MGSEIDLEDLATRLGGNPMDLKLAIAARKLPSGSMVAHVAAAQVIGGGTQQSLSSNAEELRDLMNSAWDTEYVTQDGARISARVELNKDGNRFVTPDFTGSLERVFLTKTSDGAIIQGAWKGAGAKGLFTFDISGERLNQLRGAWKFSGQKEWFSWEGTRNE